MVFFNIFSAFFSKYLAPSAAKNCKKKQLILKCWFLAPQAPETSIWAPEGAFGPKRQFFAYFLDLFGIYSGFEDSYWVGMSGSLVEKLREGFGKGLGRVWEGLTFKP